MPEPQKRQIAYKVRIKEITNGKYIKKEGWQPNYIVTDDGTGRISVRNFEQNKIFDDIEIGEVILIIGRPREYGNEIYLLPEVLKKIQDKGWIKVREIELGKEKNKDIKESKKGVEEIREEMVEDVKEPIADKVICDSRS